MIVRTAGRRPQHRGHHAGRAAGLQVEVLTYGAILRRLSYPVRGVRRDLILHFDRLEHYVRDRAYVGSLVGPLRQSHRRRPLRARRHGRTRSPPTKARITCTAARWASASGCGACSTSSERHGRRVVLGLHSPDGEEGYPGNVEATVELAVKPRCAGDHPERAQRRRHADQPHLSPVFQSRRRPAHAGHRSVAAHSRRPLSTGAPRA